MGRFALALTFFSSGLTPLIQYLYNVGAFDAIPYLDRVLCLPALFLGLMSWCRVRTFAHKWQTIACVVFSLVGVLFTDYTERGRGMLVFAGIATSLPIAALIVELRATRWCAQVFIAGALVNILFMVVLLGGVVGLDNRFGFLVLNDVRLSDPNELATQMGLSAVLIISLMQHLRRSQNGTIGKRSGNGIWLLPMLGILCVGILLTASRSGILSLALVMILFAFSKTTKVAYRVLICLSLCLVSFWAVGTNNDIARRFQESHNTYNLGDRMPIWQEAFRIIDSDSRYYWFGVGTGGAEKALAESRSFDTSSRLGEDGLFRKATHNSYVEWFLTHGLVGLIIAGCLTVATLRTAWQLDKYDRSADRRILLAYCAVISMVTALYRTPFATPLCALVLAVLSGPFLAPWPEKSNPVKTFASADKRSSAAAPNFDSPKPIPSRRRALQSRRIQKRSWG